MSKRLIQYGKLKNPSRPGKIRIFDDILRNLLNRRFGAVQNAEINKLDGIITRGQLPTPEPPRVIRKPTAARNDKNNMEMRMICADMSIVSTFKRAEPSKKAQTLKIPPLCETVPSGRHISKARNKRINQNIPNGEREKNESTTGILRFYPLKTLIILPKELDRAPPLTGWTETIAAKIGRSNQSIISKPNRCTTIPYFRRYVWGNKPNFAGKVKTGIFLNLALHKRGCIIRHSKQPRPHCYQQTAYFFLAGGRETLS